MPSLGQMVKVPIAERLEHPYFLKGDETGKARVADDLIKRFQITFVPSLKKIESRFEKTFPFEDLKDKIRSLDIEKHKTQLWKTFRGIREAEVLTGGRVEIPVCSFEELGKTEIRSSYEISSKFPKTPGIRFNSGLIWSREANEYSLYFDYIITHIRDLETYEWLESNLPDAAYFDFYVPMKLKDKDVQCSVLGSWQQLSEATKRYQLYELVSVEENKYFTLLKIDDVHIALNMNLRTKQLHIRKHMYQGKSMSPTKVLEKIERNDELVVLTARIPLWLKQKMENEAKREGEQLGTHLRKVLEQKYD